MYHPTEVIIKHCAIEIQPAMAIDPGGDSLQARLFIKKSIVDKCFQASCRLYPGAIQVSSPEN